MLKGWCASSGSEATTGPTSPGPHVALMLTSPGLHVALMLTSRGPHVALMLTSPERDVTPMLTSPGPHVILAWQGGSAISGEADGATVGADGSTSEVAMGQFGWHMWTQVST